MNKVQWNTFTDACLRLIYWVVLPLIAALIHPISLTEYNIADNYLTNVLTYFTCLSLLSSTRQMIISTGLFVSGIVLEVYVKFKKGENK